MPNQNKSRAGQIDPASVPRIRGEKYVEFYTNNSEIGISAWDCRVKFGQLREDEKGKVVVDAQAIAIMSLHHAKALALALTQTINQYEKANGSLSIPSIPQSEGDIANTPASTNP